MVKSEAVAKFDVVSLQNAIPDIFRLAAIYIADARYSSKPPTLAQRLYWSSH
jgi:hypothetical protein